MAEPDTVLPQMRIPWHETTSPATESELEGVTPGNETDHGYRPRPMSVLIGSIIGGAIVMSLIFTWEANHRRHWGPTPTTPAGVTAPAATGGGPAAMPPGATAPNTRR